MTGAKAQKIPRAILIGLVAGIPSGLAAVVFLHLLDAVTQARQEHPQIIWALPLVGLLIGWVYHDYGRDSAPGANLIIEEIHSPKKQLPLRMAPLLAISTFLTHLFGGSAGREGVAVQMGAALADEGGRHLGVTPTERRALLLAGSGAGFGAAVGSPWAGVVFGMEMIYAKRLRPTAVLECLVASFAAFAVARLALPHSAHWPQVPWVPPTLPLVAGVVGGSILFGLSARVFVYCTHGIESLQQRFVTKAQWRPFFGGLLLVALYWLEGSYRYVGLGIDVIQQGLENSAPWRDSLLKILFTALTIGSGFKGGEFVPLVFTGAALGSALAGALGLPVSILASVGFAAVFAAAANAPVACTLMAVDLFGWPVAPYALSGCLIAFAVSGRHGIYKRQR